MIRKSLIALSGAALLGVSTPAVAQEPASTVRETHGSWDIRCANDNPQACLMAQTGNNAQGQPVIQALVRKTPGLKGPQGEDVAAVVEIIAPIGVFLPAGVQIKIDGREVGRGAYRVCNPQACLVAEPVAADFIDQLKRGSNAVMTIAASNGESADITISLSGFTKAFNSL
ncbi:MAG: invasion associated locus B family protein [Pseudomonadota bacterium]